MSGSTPVSTDDYALLSSMPYFIAAPYMYMMKEQNPEKKVYMALRVYEIGLRTLSLAIVSQYLTRDHKQAYDPEFNELLKTSLPINRINVWQKILFSGLHVYGNHRNLLFVRELDEFFWDRKINPPRPRHSMEDTGDPFNQLTLVANNIAARLIPETEADWQTLMHKTLSLLRQVLGYFLFLCNYEIVFVLKRDGSQYWLESHTGTQKSLIQDPIQSDVELKTGRFYLSNKQGDFLQMHPLLIVWKDDTRNDDVAIFEGYNPTDDALQYLTIELLKTIFDKNYLSDFFLLYAILESEGAEGAEIIEKKYVRLDWWGLKKIAQKLSTKQKNTFVEKFQPELYLQRNKVNLAFKNFLISDKTGFILVGKAGVGKSNFILALESEYGQDHEQVCMLVYDGTQLDARKTISELVGQDISKIRQVKSKEGFESIWDEMAKIDGIDQKKVVIIIDAINENPDALQVLSNINELICDSRSYPWLKVVVTSRPEAWKTIYRGVHLYEEYYYHSEGEENLEVELEPFNYSQILNVYTQDELREVYTKYQKTYHLHSNYNDLHINVRRTLREPLLLRLVARTYSSQEIPQDIQTREVYEKYLDDLIHQKRLTLEDTRFLEKELMQLMINKVDFLNSISAKQIDTAKTEDGRSIYDLIHNDGKLINQKQVNQSYTNLVDAGILIKRGSALNYKIDFQFETFYDYHAGNRIYQMNSQAEDKVDAYNQQILLIQEKPFLWGAVHYALIQELAAKNTDLIFSLCKNLSVLARRMLTSVLKEYGQEEPAVVENIFSKIMASKSADLTGAKQLAVEVSCILGFSKVLISGAIDPVDQLRVYTIMQVFHLWRIDYKASRDQEDPITNRGIETLSNLSFAIRGHFGFPRTKVLLAVIAISLLIFIEAPKDPEIRRDLQLLWKRIFDGMLGGIGIVRILFRLGIGRFALVILSRILSFLLKDNLRYNVANFDEFRTFFKLPDEQKHWLDKFLPYLNPDHNENYVDLSDIMATIFENDDLLSGGTVALSFVIQGRKKPEDVIAIITELFENEMKLTPPQGALAVAFLAAALYQLLKEQVTIEDDVWKLVNHIAEAPLDKSKGNRGVLLSGAKKKYFCISFLYPPLLYISKFGQPGMHLWHHYLDIAISEQDWQFLDDLIFIIGEIAIPYRYPGAALTIIRELFQYENENVKKRVLDLLARLRFYYPDQIDDFLDKENCPDESIKYIANASPKESFMQLIVSRFALFVIDALYDEPTRELYNQVIKRAIHSRYLSVWLSYLIAEVANTIYGSEILPIKNLPS